MSDNKKEKQKKEPAKWYALPFLLVLAVITVISFIIPLRPTRSNSEKRDLAVFPEFTVEALLSGDYFDDITLWFSDTFPGRESWIEIASYSDSLYGSSDIMIQGELPVTETIPLVPTPSQTQPTEQTVPTEGVSVQETEQTLPPEETEPEGWGGVDAGDAAEILQSATAIQIGDAVFCAQGFSQQYSDRYVQVVNEFCAAVAEKGVTVVSAPAPTAVGVLIEEEYLPKLNSVSQVQLLNYLHAGMSEQVVKVDTASALIAHNDEYIFFRTDHHWTALGAYYSYEAICQALGMTPVDINTLEIWNQGTFKGSLYGKASAPHRLTLDTVDAYVPKGELTNYAYGQSLNPYEIPVLADTTEREENTKYLVFGTDYPMTQLVNESIPDAPNVLIIKDSFGNCMPQFLSQNFHNVYACDYRKFRTLPLVTLVEQFDIDYVVVMPYVTATQSSDGAAMIRRMCMGG